MNILKTLGLFIMIGTLVACAGAGPKQSALDPATRNLVRIDAVTVDITNLGSTTEGQKISTDSVKQILEREVATLVGKGTGSTSTRVVIDLQSVNLISVGQSMLIGGESVMRGTVTLVNNRTGEVVIPSTEIDSGGGGWMLGGLIGAATRDDPATELRQMSAEFVDRINVLVFGI